MVLMLVYILNKLFFKIEGRLFANFPIPIVHTPKNLRTPIKLPLRILVTDKIYLTAVNCKNQPHFVIIKK